MDPSDSPGCSKPRRRSGSPSAASAEDRPVKRSSPVPDDGAGPSTSAEETAKGELFFQVSLGVVGKGISSKGPFIRSYDTAHCVWR